MDTTDTTDAQPPEEPQRTPRRGIARPPRVRRPTATADATPNDAPPAEETLADNGVAPVTETNRNQQQRYRPGIHLLHHRGPPPRLNSHL